MRLLGDERLLCVKGSPQMVYNTQYSLSVFLPVNGESTGVGGDADLRGNPVKATELVLNKRYKQTASGRSEKVVPPGWLSARS